MNSFDHNTNQSTICSSNEQKKTQSPLSISFSNYLNDMSKKLYSSIANELNKISQNDLSLRITQVFNLNEINGIAKNDIISLVDNYFTEVNIIKTNCLSTITQYINQIAQYSHVNMNNSLDESIGILNSLSESIQKLLKGTKIHLKSVSVGFKALATYYGTLSDFLRKQKPINALEKLETIIKKHNEFDISIKEINDSHDVFYQETKGFFKQLKDLHDERSKKRSLSPKVIKSSSSNNNLPIPNFKSKGKLPTHHNTKTSSYMSYTNNGKTLTNNSNNNNKSINNKSTNSNNKSLNKSPFTSKRIDTSSDHYSSSGEQNKTIKTISSNKSFNTNNTSSKFYSTVIDPESSLHLIKKKNSLLIKENNTLKASKYKDRQEKTFLLKEITKLNSEIEKYKESGFMINSTVSEMIKGGQLQRLFTYKDFNNLLTKISKNSQMTIGFANSLSVLQDNIIKHPSSTVESKLLYDALKKNLIQIINDITQISKSIIIQYENSTNINGQCFEQNNKIEETEELQNEIFELKTQMAMVHSQHTEEISKMQKKINDSPSKIQQQTFSPSKNKQSNDDEITKLKIELMNKTLNESALEKELTDLKMTTTNEIEQLKMLLVNKDNIHSLNYNESAISLSQVPLDNLKMKHNQNIEQLKKAYQETIESKDKMIFTLNESNSKLKSQIENIHNEKNTIETTLSNNLIQYEIDISNLQNDKMQIEILLEEQKSIAHFNDNKIKELTSALLSKENDKDKYYNLEKEKEIEYNNSLLIAQQKKEEELTIQYNKLQEENHKLNLKIIELSSIVESKELIEENFKQNCNTLKEKIDILTENEKNMLLKYDELHEQHIKIIALNDSLLVDKMVLSQRNDNLNTELIKQVTQHDIIKDTSTLVSPIERIYLITKEEISISLFSVSKPIKAKSKTTPIKKTVKKSFILKALATTQEFSIELIGLQSKDISKEAVVLYSSWEKLTIAKQICLVEIRKLESYSSRSEKQLINKQKEELAVLKGKLAVTVDHSTKLNKQLEEIESNFNAEKEEYKGMLRVAFQKLIIEIQLSPKLKEFSTVILKMLDYSDDDIFDLYNSGKKKTLFGGLFK